MIEIITYHKSTNYGALLQSLSLKEFVEEKTKQQVKMCDFHPKKLIFAEFYRPLITKKINKLIQTIKKNIEIYNWYKEAFKNNNSSQKKILSIYGSDEIWNFKNAYHGYNSFYFGNDNDYPKISYAASIGKSSFDDLDKNIQNEISINLKKFKNISVRDINTYNFIEKLTGIKPDLVLDPTLIHTPHILNQKKFIKFKIDEKYLVVYGTVFNQKQKQIINDFAQKKNLKIISVGYFNLWIKKNYLGLNPTNFIDIIKNSSYVFTSMFHGVMFSLKFSKQFYLSIDPIRKNKLETLINILSLNNRIFQDHIKDGEINYDNISAKLNQMIASSQQTLINYLYEFI